MKGESVARFQMYPPGVHYMLVTVRFKGNHINTRAFYARHLANHYWPSLTKEDKQAIAEVLLMQDLTRSG